MALPNYAPEGTIRFGSVPWDDGYANVRLYSSLEQQLSDISSLMTISSDNYSYIGRNRRLKVAIPADRLYHCNYCMYLNSSVTSGYIYCFVRDVQYVNDSTAEVSIETDVFQTYLYNVDWSMPPCFIERETTPSENDSYLLTSEPDFTLTYIVDEYSGMTFDVGAYIIQTSAVPQQNESIIDTVLNPTGYYAQPSEIAAFKGTPMGAAMYGMRASSITGLMNFLQGLNYAGSTESIVSLFVIPSFAADALSIGASTPHLISGFTSQDSLAAESTSFNYPSRGNTIDGYTPRNRKLLYWPYTMLRLTDFNGSESNLRYELLGSNSHIAIKYAPTPSCKAVAYPSVYAGSPGFPQGLTIACGAIGSWSNNQFQQWVAQNSGTILLSIAGAAVMAAGGAATIAGATAALSAGATTVASGATAYTAASLGEFAAGMGLGKAALAGGLGKALDLGATALNASKQPTITRGQTDPNVLYMTGMQGVWAQKVCVKAEIAEQIDEFFDRFGYAVERIEAVNITSRPAWNYVKTGGSAPRSLNGGTTSTAPFTRGAGTPAEALDLIRRCFDRGITFWHTTSGFGDYSADNSL